MFSPARLRPSGRTIPIPGHIPLPTTGPGPGLKPANSPGAPRTRVIATDPSFVSTSGDAKWQLIGITEQSRSIFGMDGRPLMISGTQGPTPLGALQGAPDEQAQWMDPDLASGCVAEARGRLLRATLAQSWADLSLAFGWIANSYNALNLPWQCDPRARMLWRKYMSGPAGSAVSEFDSRQNWNSCTTPDQQLDPRTFVCQSPRGIIPAAGRAVLGRCLPDRTAAPNIVGQFVSGLWIGQDISPGVPPELPPDAMPASFLANPASGVWPTRYADVITAGEPHIQNYVDVWPGGPFVLPPTGGNALHGGGFGMIRDAACAPGTPNGWTTYGFDSGWVGAPPPLRYSAAYADYLNWINEWITALEERTAAQIVLDARYFVVYLNGMTLQVNSESLAAAQRAQVQNGLSEFTPNPQAGMDLALVRGATGATAAAVSALVAAAVGTATVAAATTAGIGALVVGAISAITYIAASLWPPDTTDWRFDDLCRRRPFLDRNWLAGSPALQTRAGAPTTIVIPAPPGWQRPLQVYLHNPVPPPVPVTPSAPMSGGAKAALAVGGVAAVGYVLDVLDIVDFGSLFKRK